VLVPEREGRCNGLNTLTKARNLKFGRTKVIGGERRDDWARRGEGGTSCTATSTSTSQAIPSSKQPREARCGRTGVDNKDPPARDPLNWDLDEAFYE